MNDLTDMEKMVISSGWFDPYGGVSDLVDGLIDIKEKVTF